MAIAHVATMAAAAGDSNDDVTTGTGDTTGANLVMFFAAGDTNYTPVDSKGNTLTGLTRYSNGGATGVRIWYAAGSPTVGSSHSGSHNGPGTTDYPSLGGMAFSGAHATPLDVENGSGGTGASPQSTGSITPSVDGCLVVTAIGTYGDATYTCSPLSVTSFAGVGAFSDGLAFGYEIQTTATARNPSWTWGTGFGNEGGRTVASFKPAGGGGVTIPVFMHHYMQQRAA